VNLANYQCVQLIHERFHRLDPVLTELVDIDAVGKMDLLKQIADDSLLDDTERWIAQHFALTGVQLEQTHEFQPEWE
jgi:hypothetical protein